MIIKIDGKNKLKIFQNFSIDHNLPKHKKKTYISNIITVTTNTVVSNNNIFPITNIIQQGDDDKTTEPNWNLQTSFIPVNQIVIGEGIVGDPDALSLNEMLMYTSNFWNRVWIRLKYHYHHFLKFFKKKEIVQQINYTALQDFFQRIPFQNIEQSVELVKYYEDALLHVEKTGQVALKEKLKTILLIVRNEIALLDNNMTKYVSEENVVSLYEKVNADQKLKLTWIKNFIKIIPTEVLKLKELADALEIFDNYVILHYDPNNDATNLTEEETMAAKDPILFGVVNNSNKLYYIADWVDEYCNLTLESMFETLGEKVLEINNNSVKSYINNVK